jgi:hypothetical protein
MLKPIIAKGLKATADRVIRGTVMRLKTLLTSHYVIHLFEV